MITCPLKIFHTISLLLVLRAVPILTQAEPLQGQSSHRGQATLRVGESLVAHTRQFEPVQAGVQSQTSLQQLALFLLGLSHLAVGPVLTMHSLPRVRPRMMSSEHLARHDFVSKEELTIIWNLFEELGKHYDAGKAIFKVTEPMTPASERIEHEVEKRNPTWVLATSVFNWRKFYRKKIAALMAGHSQCIESDIRKDVLLLGNNLWSQRLATPGSSAEDYIMQHIPLATKYIAFKDAFNIDKFVVPFWMRPKPDPPKNEEENQE